jgi:diadenosine tetraphosphate (Ap4A) HIT family hydrolase
MTFQLDSRLANDCYQLAESEHSLWLLLNNSYFPWFVVVPKTACTELYQLSKEQQEQLQRDTNFISEFAGTHFNCDKLNVASIGNIVKQMHIHIIARQTSDPCWPGVVWGTSFQRCYENIAEVQKIQSKLKQFCENKSIFGLNFTSLL